MRTRHQGGQVVDLNLLILMEDLWLGEAHE
jgi:hypothetical protein